MNKMNYDAVIIGGGASGLMCAISAKQKNHNLRVAIIEKNDRVGKKLLSTGNGRCNLTNKNISSKKYSGSFSSQSSKIWEHYTTDCLLDIFSGLGLMTCSDNEGRIYPLCKQASAVLDVLRFSCERLGAEIFCSDNIKSIRKNNKGFVIITDKREYCSENLVIACGSKAAPKLGGNASASDYLKNFGHTMVPFSPALCPIKVNSDILKSLKGIRSLCNATLFDNRGNIICSEKGEIQFTDSALSGICIFNLSVYSRKGYKIILDLLPDISNNELINILERHKNLFSTLTIDNILTGIVQKRLAQAVLKLCGIKDFSQSCANISDDKLKAICKAIKAMKFEVIENTGFEQAQCALGGVNGNEIDENTMQSKIVSRLFITGEAIDICGECGGFNLHFAFSSGHLAGKNL